MALLARRARLDRFESVLARTPPGSTHAARRNTPTNRAVLLHWYAWGRHIPQVHFGHISNGVGRVKDVSGHTTYTRAIVHVLEHVFGRDVAFEAINVAGQTRSYASFRALSDEMIEARILAGIHFRTADLDGDRLGRQVAQFAIRHTLRPAHPSHHE